MLNFYFFKINTKVRVNFDQLTNFINDKCNLFRVLRLLIVLIASSWRQIRWNGFNIVTALVMLLIKKLKKKHFFSLKKKHSLNFNGILPIALANLTKYIVWLGASSGILRQLRFFIDGRFFNPKHGIILGYV